MTDWLNVSHISFQELRKIAYECGFMKRQSKKIDAASFLADICFTRCPFRAKSFQIHALKGH
jgi:hypothetical protein